MNTLKLDQLMDPEDTIVDFEIMSRISSVVVITSNAYLIFK